MRIVFASLLILIASCQSVKRKNRNVPNENFPELLPKIDASSLHVDMKAEEYKNKTYGGVLFTPSLDPNADYISYEICSVENPKASCVKGRMDGLMPEVIYDSPYGEIEIFFQACVKESRAIKEPCASKESIKMTHTVKNSAPLYLK